nr:hypothetical protein GCM10020063_034050 [Dactylosporangium thailandense]
MTTTNGSPADVGPDDAPTVVLTARPEFTIVIPTRNEARNVGPLLDRLRSALGEVRAEVVFVDDSDDDTPEAVRSAMGEPGPDVRLLHRPEGARAGGLGGAVSAGIASARAPWAIVMDGDLQHPPEVLVEIMAAARAGSTADGRPVDVVVASRYTGDGAARGLDGRFRRLASRASGAVAKIAFPRRLAAVSDPMSGFFAVRCDAVRHVDLRPVGYKILLEILVRARIDRVREVPYTFEAREAGASKASAREGLRFGRHLAGLRLSAAARPGPGFGRALAFAGAGATGVLVNSAVLWALSGLLHLPYLLAAVLSTQAAITWNFFVVDRFVMPASERQVHRRFGRFWLINNCLAPVHLAVLAGLVQGLGLHLLIANAIGIGVVFVLRYVATSRWVYGERDGAVAGAIRRVAVTGRRSVPTRIVLVLLLTLAAFPAVALAVWRGFAHGQHVSLLVPLAAAGVFLAERLAPSPAEPKVHDRQVDGLIATVLLVAAVTLAGLTPAKPGVGALELGLEASAEKSSIGLATWATLAMVCYLAGATVLLLGTRTAARLRWALVLPLLAANEAAPAGLARLLGPVGGAPALSAVLCLMLAGLSCYGLSRRLLVRAPIAVAAVALVGALAGLLDRRPPATSDLALTLTVAGFTFAWLRDVAMPRADGVHYVPRGRLALAALTVVALALGFPGSPLLSAIS